MNAKPVSRPPRRRKPAQPQASAGNVFDFDRARILQALDRRERYKYVQPAVEREGAGWKVVSPNCSRNVDPEGGVIDIAWLVPKAGLWQLHARDHVRRAWVLKAAGLTLAAALDLLCADAAREYWQ